MLRNPSEVDNLRVERGKVVCKEAQSWRAEENAERTGCLSEEWTPSTDLKLVHIWHDFGTGGSILEQVTTPPLFQHAVVRGSLVRVHRVDDWHVRLPSKVDGLLYRGQNRSRHLPEILLHVDYQQHRILGVRCPLPNRILLIRLRHAYMPTQNSPRRSQQSCSCAIIEMRWNSVVELDLLSPNLTSCTRKWNF